MKPITRMMLLSKDKDRDEDYRSDRNRRREVRRYDNERSGRMSAGMPYRQYPTRPYPPMPISPGMHHNRDWDDGDWDENEPYRDTNMGFMHNKKGYEFEMDGQAGDMAGYAKGRVYPVMGGRSHKKSEKERFEPLTEDSAKQWARSMKNEDGTKGAHWTMEQTTKIMKDLKEDFDEIDFWLAMNATYSDLCKEFKKYNIDRPEAYADFAIAFWLCDEDAVEDKLSAYYEFITI